MMKIISKFSINVYPMCNTTIYIPAIILNFMTFWYLLETNVMLVSPRVIILTGHMTGQPFNSVNLLVKPRSSQSCQYLTLTVSKSFMIHAFKNIIYHSLLCYRVIHSYCNNFVRP